MIIYEDVSVVVMDPEVEVTVLTAVEVHDSVLKDSALVDAGGDGSALETVLAPVNTTDEVSVNITDPDVDVNVST